MSYDLKTRGQSGEGYAVIETIAKDDSKFAITEFRSVSRAVGMRLDNGEPIAAAPDPQGSNTIKVTGVGGTEVRVAMLVFGSA